MRKISLGLVVALAMTLVACGGGEGSVDVGPREAVLQIASEGGFVPVEFALGSGPRYTLLGDGTLIFSGVTTLEFPGRLVPQYWTAQLSRSQMRAILAMVDEMGLSDVVDETDDSAANFVADAGTDIIRYWDVNGEHRYAVYALGIDEDPNDRNRVFLELIATLDEFTAQTSSDTYEADRIRVVVGSASPNPDFPDMRPWPLEEDWGGWTELPNGWTCRVFDPSVLSSFADATQATTWEIPDGGPDFTPAKLLVRPLHPGEADCPL